MTSNHMVPDREPAINLTLRRFLWCEVTLLTGGYTFLDYWGYSLTTRLGGWREWDNVLHGQCYAPEQYRIGVIYLAALMARLTHTHLRHTFAVIDFVSAGISLGVLLWLLSQSTVFRMANRIGQWLQATILLGSTALYLMWTLWYQKPETLPSLLLLVLSVAAAHSRKRFAPAFVLIVLAAIGATVRVDAVCALNAGFLVLCLFPKGDTLPLGRTTQAVASSLAVICAAGVEWYIAHRMYPKAPRQNEAFQLIANLRSGLSYLVLAVSLFPWIATIGLAIRRWRTLGSWAMALLLGSLIQFVLFYTFGIAWEVRIFLPFAITVLPVTTILVYETVSGSAAFDSLH